MLLVSMLLVYKQIPTQLPEINYVVMKRVISVFCPLALRAGQRPTNSEYKEAKVSSSRKNSLNPRMELAT